MTKVKTSMGKVNLQREPCEFLKKSTARFIAADTLANKLTSLEKMEKAKAGLSKTDLERLKARTGLDFYKLSRALAVTRATLINKKGVQKFSLTLSERIIGLEDIYSYGYEVFQDEAKFKLWMFRPNKALGGRCPYDIIDSQFGREEVKDLIGRIDYGVYS